MLYIDQVMFSTKFYTNQRKMLLFNILLKLEIGVLLLEKTHGFVEIKAFSEYSTFISWASNFTPIKFVERSFFNSFFVVGCSGETRSLILDEMSQNNNSVEIQFTNCLNILRSSVAEISLCFG